MDIVAKFNAKDLQTAFLVEFAARLNSFMPGVLGKIPQLIATHVDDYIKKSSDYAELISGRVYGEIGAVNMNSAIQDIISAIATNAEIKFDRFKASNTRIDGSISIGILQKDYSEVLNLPSVRYFTDTGVEIPWLQWLLLQGDTKVISGFNFSLTSRNAGKSRTGTGIMVKSQLNWGIPPTVAGTASNNFLTRALHGIDEKIILELYTIIGKL